MTTPPTTPPTSPTKTIKTVKTTVLPFLIFAMSIYLLIFFSKDPCKVTSKKRVDCGWKGISAAQCVTVGKFQLRVMDVVRYFFPLVTLQYDNSTWFSWWIFKIREWLVNDQTFKDSFSSNSEKYKLTINSLNTLNI